MLVSSDSTPTFVGSKSRRLTSHTNVNLSVLEAVLGSSFTTPKYAKARAQNTPAIERAEVAVNAEVVSVMAILSRCLSPSPATCGREMPRKLPGLR